ncbi:MAG: TIM barrel protein [Kiritimatiellae bacterium]|nr:TIM barrel protein [Kiritimatiellia bacterium]
MNRMCVFAAIALVSVMTARAADALPCAGISVFHWTIQDLAKERGISIVQAAQLFKAAGVDGFDCEYCDVRLHEFASTGLKPINLFGSVKFRVPDRGEAQIRDFLAVAVRYHVPRVMVIPDRFSDGEPHEEEFQDIVDGFRRFVAAAQKVGITVTVETFGNRKNACSYAKYIKRLLDEVPGLCFALDTGNLHFAGRGDDIVDVAHHAANRIAHVHLKDWKKGMPPIGPKGERNYETVGLGAIPNEELVRYAQSVGFRGWYTLEHPLPGDTLGDTVRQIAILKYWLSSPKPSTAAPNRLWKEVVFDAPETRPMRFGGWSRSMNARFGDYAVVMDVYYADGTKAWDRRASFAPGTHDWSYSAGVFAPEKPVKRVKIVPVARKGSGTAEFTGLFFDFEVFDGMPLRTELRTSRPFADADEQLVIVREEKKPKKLDYFGRKESFIAKPVPERERQFLRSPLVKGVSAVWTADSMRRVTPLTFPGSNEMHAISLELARREHESAQILVSTAEDAEWTHGELSVGAFADASGRPFHGTISWQRVGYLPREPGFAMHPYGTDLREKWLPDPLLPAAPFRVRKGATQALWITAYAADDAAPGVYRGEIVVTERGERRAVVPVELTVRGFSLPRTFGLKTAFAVMDGFLKARYPDADLKAKRREAWDILLDHRLNPDDITRTTLPDLDDLAYARQRGMNHFTVLNIVPETKPGQKWTLVADPKVLFTPEFYASFTARIRPYVAELRARNLLDIASLYGFDERTSEYYAGIDEMWKKLRVDFPGLPLMTTAKMYADLAANKTNLPVLVTADIYCPCTYRWNEATTAKLRAAGKKVWWYTCCSPFAPYANFASYESPTMEGRLLLGFMTHKYRADGFLFWHVNNWKEDRHPTMKADDTFFPDWKTYNWVGCPGDGVFLYPGEDEIYPSVRLAQLCDGVEDYEWLQLAVEKVGRMAVDGISDGLIASLTEFNRDPDALRVARGNVANLIESANKELESPNKQGNEKWCAKQSSAELTE